MGMTRTLYSPEPKTNMEPENHPFEKEINFPLISIFLVPPPLVFGSGGVHPEVEHWVCPSSQPELQKGEVTGASSRRSDLRPCW